MCRRRHWDRPEETVEAPARTALGRATTSPSRRSSTPSASTSSSRSSNGRARRAASSRWGSARATSTRQASCTRAGRRPATSSRSSTTPGRDVAIPKRKFGFRRLIEAQAAGDYEALKARGRPVVRIKLEDAMNLGMVGLGKMGGNMTERLRRAGHTVETYARTDPARTTGSLVELVGKLDYPRVVWLMIPAGDPTENAFQTLVPLLEDGDIIVDGGNSNFRDSQRRAEVAGAKSVHFLDAGVVGRRLGPRGGLLHHGRRPRRRLRLIEPFVARTRAGGRLRARRRVRRGALREDGPQRHRVRDDAVARRGLRDHSASELELDLGSWRPVAARLGRPRLAARAARAGVRRGSRSQRHPRLRRGSGEGRWTVQTAIDERVPAPAITLALFSRFASRQDESSRPR